MPPITKKDLKEYFLKSCKSKEQRLIGIEVEKFGVHTDTGRAITYFEENGARAIQAKLIEELGWKATEWQDKYITELERCCTRLTLENDGTLELSGKTHKNIHDLSREFRLHQNEVNEISKLFKVSWLGIGNQPFSALSDIQLIRPARYAIIEKFLKGRGKLGAEWLKKSASIQANVDFFSEEDAMRKFQTLLRISPILSGMFANSPMNNGKLTGYLSYRTHILQSVDPERFNLKKVFFSKNMGFDEWIDYCLDLPLLFIERGTEWIQLENCTFGNFLEKGYQGYEATLEDWVLHLSAVYPDARLRSYIELRSCDSLPPKLVPAFAAMIKGLIYDDDTPDLIEKMTKAWTFEDHAESREAIAKDGLYAVVAGKRILDYARELILLATENLKKQSVAENIEDESIYLQPIKELVMVQEKSPARIIAEKWEGEWQKNPQRLLEWCSY
jgi:glutamate--cysteine ligase